MIPFHDEVPLLKDPYGAKSRWLAQPKVVMHPKRKTFRFSSVWEDGVRGCRAATAR